MKKILFLMMAVLTIVGCSKDNDDTNVDLSGNYISEEGGISEVLILNLNNDNTGTWEFYDKGELIEKKNSTWSATSSKLTFKDANGKVESINYSLKGSEFILGDVVYRKTPNETFSSMSGHTYVAVNWEYSKHKTIFNIYTFNQDGSISIEERYDTPNGNLSSTYKGKYKIESSNIKLDIQSSPDCDNCWNYFTASLNPNYKSFTYEVYDMTIGKKRTLFFYATK